MRTLGITSTAIAFLILAIATPAYARQEQRPEKQDEAKPEQQRAAKPQQEHAQPAPKQQQPQHAQQAQRPEQNKQPQQAKQQPKPDQTKAPQQARQQPQHNQDKQQQQVQKQHQPQTQKVQPQQAQQQRPEQNKRPQQAHASPHPTQQQQHVQQAAFQQHRTGSWQSDHRTWQQRGGYNGYRIPDDRFRGYFGPEHGFRIYGLPFQTVGGYPRFQYQGYWMSLVDPWPNSWAGNWYDTDDVYVGYVDNGYYLFDTRYPGVGLAISISN